MARLVPGKQAWRRLAVRPGALYTHPAFNRQPNRQPNRQSNRRSKVERKLDKVLQNQDKMQEDIGQLKMDMAVNKALVLVNLTPAASLVLGVLYFVYSNFMASGGGSG